MRSLFGIFRSTPQPPAPDPGLTRAMESSERELRSVRAKVEAARQRLEREIARQTDIDDMTARVIPARTPR